MAWRISSGESPVKNGDFWSMNRAPKWPPPNNSNQLFAECVKREHSTTRTSNPMALLPSHPVHHPIPL